MSFNTLAKRLSTNFDSGLIPYPDSVINRIDRAFLTNFWFFGLSVSPTVAKRLSRLIDSGVIPYPDGSTTTRLDRNFLVNQYYLNELLIWEKSYLGKIYYNLIDILSDIGTVNQDDFNKVTFPLFNIFIKEEVNERDFDVPSMDAFVNMVTFEIHCYDKINIDSSNSNFHIESKLDTLLDLLVDTINNNKTINGLTEGEFYITSKREKVGIGEDIMLPKKLVIELSVNYSQSMKSPSVPAY